MEKIKYFDSHSHYYDERFRAEYEGSVDELIGALLNSTVSHIINVGTSPETCRLAIEQARRHENMYTALGIHPSDTRFLSDIECDLCEIEEMIKNKSNKCVCLGEIGLDYHYPDTDKEKQMLYFERQMQLAERLSLPICVHDREAHADVLSVLKKYPKVHGIIHSYSGSAEMARELERMGCLISFSGTISFKNARKTKEAAAVLSPKSVLIETDCPYLAPHPLRGTLNHSGNLSYTCTALSEALGISEEECARTTCENAMRIFGLTYKTE